VIAVILGTFVLHEPIDVFIIAGTLVIVVGVVLVTTANVKKVKPASTPVAPEEREAVEVS
jgi:drug/metabolite transporter (DMT)-like permease